MRKSVLRLVGIAAAASLTLGSTAASAAASPAPAQINPWQALSVLNGGASTIAYCGAAAAAQVGTGCVLPQVDAAPAAVQVVDQPIPPPLPGATAGFTVSPLLIALGVLAVGALAYLLLKGKGHHSNSPV